MTYQHGVVYKPLTLEETFDNVKVHIVTFPEGAGQSFLGYLQDMYIGKRKYIKIDKNISWFGTFNTSLSMFNIFPPEYDKLEDLYPTVIRGGIGMAIQQLWQIPIKEWTETYGLTVSRSDEQEKLMIKLAKWIQNMKKVQTTINGEPGVMLYTHFYPYGRYGIHRFFKNVEYSFALQTKDIETQIYCEQLKTVKSNKPKEDVIEKANIIHNNEIKANARHNPKVVTDYKKFFFDIDENEIKNFFLGTMDKIIGEFDNKKLDPICDMIKSYTRINKELLNARNI